MSDSELVFFYGQWLECENPEYFDMPVDQETGFEYHREMVRRYHRASIQGRCTCELCFNHKVRRLDHPPRFIPPPSG